MSQKKLILIELNEINFDLAKKYKEENFKSFNIINDNILNTESELEYHNLEPWIQWVSVHTGLSAANHNVFRLGDIVNNKHLEQIFEFLESKGLKVGCISPMNAINKLNKPTYFIPDPWTDSNSDQSFWSKLITKTLKFMVNNNAQNKFSIKAYLYLMLIFFRFAHFKHYATYFKLIFKSLRGKWNKALVLDLLMHDIHMCFLLKKDPDFSTIFFNAGAHIQHHYLFTSKFVNQDKSNQFESYKETKIDAIKDMLIVYNMILDDYLKNKSYEIIIATGLSQQPYNKEEYYYRLNDHEKFLSLLNVNFDNVLPRMSRDFLIGFKDIETLSETEKLLSSIKVKNGKNLFTIDNRNDTLFVTLSYPDQVDETTSIIFNNKKIKLLEHISLVAVKNAEHCAKGYAYFSKSLHYLKFDNGDNITKINKSIRDYFGY